MADQHQLALLKRGIEEWNEWRRANPSIRIDLHGADLHGADLHEADLHGADLSVADLSWADLHGADLHGADLSWAGLSNTELFEANLSRANLSSAHLHRADLSEADLSEADLSEAKLTGAELFKAELSGAILSETDLSEADLQGTHLYGAILSRAILFNTDLQDTHLSGTDFSGSRLNATIFSNTDLSRVQGLDTVEHFGPSTIGIDTLYRSQGKIPESFLRGCGVPEPQIEYLPALIGAMQPIQYYSCFISYSHQDKTFAQRLHERMRAANLRVWYAPEEMKGGQKLHDQIDRAIQLYDRLLVVLSDTSLQSEWVKTEIRKALKVEQREKRHKLFPIRLTNMITLDAWEWYDGGKDLAQELREYFIPDFSAWKDHNAFETAFAHLYDDLRASTETRETPTNGS